MKMKLITGNIKKMIRMLSFIIALPMIEHVQATEAFTVNVLGPLSVAAKVASPIVNAYAPPQVIHLQYSKSFVVRCKFGSI